MTNHIHIIEDAAAAASIRPSDILGRSKDQLAFRPRALAMRAARVGGLNVNQICDRFHRDPTSVKNALRRADQMLEQGDGDVVKIYAAAMRRVCPAEMTDETWTDYDPTKDPEYPRVG